MGIRGALPKARVRVALFVKVLGELLCSILQLHRSGLIHRDIKPENVLVVPEDQDCPIKLIDLGSAADMAAAIRRGLSDATIDPLYAPPELRVNMESPTSFDVFTAGITGLRVLFPSLGKNPALLKNIVDVELPAVDWNIRRWVTQRALGDASEETTWEARALQDPTLEPLLALIDPMLRRDPADRPTPQQLLRQLGPVWAARLDALEILTPEAPPMAADLFARLYRELRSNPTALAGLVTHGMMAIWGVLAPVLIDLPRHTLNTVATVTRAVSRGTLRGTKSVFRGTKKVFGWTTKALKMV
jgi:serine/threonine protein kinase